MKPGRLLVLGIMFWGLVWTWAATPELPARYFRLLGTGFDQIAERLTADPDADLKALEARPGWRHFPSSVLIGAVLYAKTHPANVRRRDAKTLSLALRIGDLLVKEHTKNAYATRLDHHRDTYMWLEAYRLLESELGEERRERWRQALTENLTPLAAEVAKRQDYAWYQSPFLNTSPNHYSLWASTLHLAGKVFGNREWESLGARVMHRFAAEEQTPDGYWGEHSRSGPTTGYDYLTATAVAVYWEHSRDPAALDALRRSTDFHKHYTYPDGTPVETINDRNRYWDVSMWGHFGFSHFSDGRRYAEFLTSFYQEDWLSLESLGRIAQNALYFHEGPAAPIPQDVPRYAHQMSVPAGIRKSGPWVTCLSGIISTQTTSRFYLDRQSSLSVFHEKLGLIVTGANSKRQPELATFSEKTGGQVVHLPLSSRLQMSEKQDRLWLAYNTFFGVLEVTAPSEKQVVFHIVITPRSRVVEALFTLQLCLKAGEPLETGAGRKVVLDEKAIDWSPEDIAGSIRHKGWTLKPAPGARLAWPLYPHNPYADSPETGLEYAVGTVTTPVGPSTRELSFILESN